MKLTTREIDALLAEKVMGWKVSDEPVFFDENGLLLPDFRPSTDISDAWLVFMRNGYFGEVGYMGDEYACRLHAGWEDDGTGKIVIATAETAPMAICLAALKSIGIDIEEE